MTDEPIKINFTSEEVEEFRQSDLEDSELVPSDHLPKSFSYHEALDRTSMVLNILDNNVLSHPAILLDPEAYRLAYEAQSKLYNLYQYLGAKHL